MCVRFLFQSESKLMSIPTIYCVSEDISTMTSHWFSSPCSMCVKVVVCWLLTSVAEVIKSNGSPCPADFCDLLLPQHHNIPSSQMLILVWEEMGGYLRCWSAKMQQNTVNWKSTKGALNSLFDCASWFPIRTELIVQNSPTKPTEQTKKKKEKERGKKHFWFFLPWELEQRDKALT